MSALKSAVGFLSARDSEKSFSDKVSAFVLVVGAVLVGAVFGEKSHTGEKATASLRPGLDATQRLAITH